MNVSINSAKKLVEACVETTNRLAHSGAASWLEELCEAAPLVTQAQITALIPYYKPPKGGRGGKKKAPETGKAKGKRTVWLLGTKPSDVEYPDDVEQILEAP